MSLAEFLDTALGKPYADPGEPPNSYNCVQIAVLARRALGLETPLVLSPDPWSSLTPDDQIALLNCTESRFKWRQVAKPDTGDIALCAARQGLASYHCGVWTPGGIVHAFASTVTGQGSVVVTRLPAFESVYAHVEFWRHA